ncbi:hypothetical protein GS399_03510 [Pedobacter sp. HMF7647]|uniref:Cardiolipin synthase N-terminal domain-containing protein n=1 Tax=Hufsiella arboris TaxID=2695275 RepID=A0A7K1Y618_9SPHI|nr:PLDc N-terminal domain-containing protein [Hufsiella arboris]MXV50026.1 hypothetical protein [Hufsiella arboris]
MNLLFISGLFSGIVGLLWLILIIYALYDIIKSNMPQNTKLLWIIIVLVAPILGSIIYLIWGKNQTINI